VSVFIDTAVIMYAGGAPHPMRSHCVDLLTAVVERRIEAVTSAEVIQEILHRFTAIDRRLVGAQMAEAALDIFAPVLPINEAIMRRMPNLVAKYQQLSARDLVHVATCEAAGIDLIVSPDRGLDQVDELRRIDPKDVAGRLL
jgi:predicted nucleic acid-binding protein